MNTLKSTWIWLCRFRHRKGYGVHSPFAYRFIRTVLNEKGQYYAYGDLQPLRSQLEPTASPAVDRLLFRLANHAQPRTVVWVGQGGSLSLRYVQAGCVGATCLQIGDVQQAIRQFQSPSWNQSVDMLILAAEALDNQLYLSVLPHITPQTVVVVQGLYDTPEHKAQWQAWAQNEPVVLAFDLYECGVMLFDTHYQKQTFKVNFIAV